MAATMGDSAVVYNDATGAETVRQWEVEYFEDDRPYAASNTAMGTDRNCGPTDWTGKYFAHGGLPIVFPGDAFTFIGEAANDKGANGTAITERAQIYWEQERGDYLQHIVHFAGNGALTLGAAVKTDASIPAPQCSSNLIVKLDGGEQADVRRAYLDIFRVHGRPPGQLGNRPYASSSTSGQIRRVKSRLDYRGWIDAYVTDHSSLPALQTAPIILLYTTAALYWELKWARITRLENIGANVEAADLLGVRIHFAMKGSNGTSLGWVKSPGPSTEWPDA